MGDIPYSRQNISDADIAAVVEALRADFLTQGPRVLEFENKFAAVHSVAHAVAVTNATAALHIACLAMDVGPGSLVWTSPISFIASANCARYCGADVDFVDIDPATRNISIDALRLKLAEAAKARKLPALVIPVDFAGLPCDLAEMRELADQYGFKILSDSSHATGAEYLGAPIGSRHTDANVFSFHAIKVVTTGEGGMVTTNDAALAQRLRLYRSHGMTRDESRMERASEGDWYYEQVALGFNYRLTDFQSALGISQLDRLTEWTQARVALADRYDRLLSDLPLRLPVRLQDRRSAWHLYAIELGAEALRPRADVFAGMRAAGIGVNVHYIPIHTQPYYRKLGFSDGLFPNAERYYSGALSLPLFPALTEGEQDHVVATLRSMIG